jgi:hypothetical protein
MFNGVTQDNVTVEETLGCKEITCGVCCFSLYHVEACERLESFETLDNLNEELLATARDYFQSQSK